MNRTCPESSGHVVFLQNSGLVVGCHRARGRRIGCTPTSGISGGTCGLRLMRGRFEALDMGLQVCQTFLHGLSIGRVPFDPLIESLD
jgi:hypothetical protein